MTTSSTPSSISSRSPWRFWAPRSSSPPSSTSQAQTERSGGAFVVSRGYDWAFFLSPPLVALGIGILVSGSETAHARLLLSGNELTWEDVALGTMIHAHLVAVLFRSHLNGRIFPRHPVRFIAVPLLAWGAIQLSAWLAVAATVLATFWDVWHSGLQTFGFARIYDRNAGNPPEAGRTADLWLNHLLYAGPILAGATMLEHFDGFEEFGAVGSPGLASIPVFMVQTHRQWAVALCVVGTLFLGYYVFVQLRLRRQGYRVSGLKVFLLTTTGACSIYSWGFNTWGEAFLIMNLFHAVQYLALVWAKEQDNVVARLKLPPDGAGKLVAALLFFGSTLAYGFAAEALVEPGQGLWAATIVISLMHFWYDGFVWSVRTREV